MHSAAQVLTDFTMIDYGGRRIPFILDVLQRCIFVRQCQEEYLQRFPALAGLCFQVWSCFVHADNSCYLPYRWRASLPRQDTAGGPHASTGYDDGRFSGKDYIYSARFH